MAKVKIKYPEHSPEERRRLLAELPERTNVNESLDSLVEEMHAFEAEYGLSTVEFYLRFTAGKLGDSRDFMRWAGVFDDYQHLLNTYVLRRAAAA